MGGFVRAVLLPVLVAGMAWVLVQRMPPPEEAASGTRTVPTLEARDSSGHGHHGIIQGRVTMEVPGHDGTAFSFSSRGSWVQVISTDELNPGADDFLVSAWINLAETPGPGETFDVVRKGIAFSRLGEFKLEVMPTGHIRCSVKGDGRLIGVVTSKGESVVDGGWHWVGCARTGTRWHVLVDDAVTSRRVLRGSVTNTVPIAIGSKYGLEDRPEGTVDEVAFVIDRGSDTSTPAAAIASLKQLPPVGWWRLDESANRVERP